MSKKNPRKNPQSVTMPPVAALTDSPPAAQNFHFSFSLVLAGLYLLTMFVGCLIFSGSIATVAGNPMRVPRAAFTAVNAGTLTGFRQSVTLDSMLLPGKLTAAGLMMCGTFFTLVISTLAVAKILRTNWSIARIVGSALVIQVLTALAGGALLFSRDRTFGEAMLGSISAFGNCGLWLGSPPAPEAFRTLFVLLPLAILGSIGLPVLLDSFDAIRHDRPLLNHSRVALKSLAAVFLIGAIGCAWLDWTGVWDSVPDIRKALAAGLTASVNSRTAGLPIGYVYDYSRAMQWLLMLLMMVGGASAGTAGGFKTNSLWVLFRGGEKALLGEPPGRPFAIALSWLGIYALLILFAQLSLLQHDPQIAGDRVLFIAISAASNVGLSHDPLSVTGENAFTLSFVMLLGRFLPMAVLWWMARTTPDADVAVG